MGINTKSKGKASSLPAGITWGSAVSVVLTFICTIVTGNLIHTERLAWEHTGYAILIQVLLASFAGAKTAYARVKRRKIFVCMLTGLIYFCILLSITALFFGGQYEAVGVTAGLVVAGSGAAGLLGSAWKREGGRRKNRYQYC